MSALSGRQRFTLLLLVILQSMIAPIVMSGLIPVHMDRLTESFGVSRGQIGTVLAVAALLSAAFGFAAGLIAERFGNLRVLLAAIAGQSVAVIVFTFTRSAWSAALLAVVFLGGMNMTCVANAISTEFFAASLKRGVNLLHAVNSLGKLGGPLVALAFAGAIWRWGFFATGAYGLGILALGFVVLGQGVHSHRPAGLHADPVLSRPLYWACILGFVLLVGAEASVTQWLPEYLREVRGFSQELKKIMQAVFLAGLVGGRLATVFFAYRLNHRQIIATCISCALFLLPAMFLQSPVLVGTFLFLHGIAFSAAYPTHFAYITRFFPEHRSALSGGTGMANPVGYAIGYFVAGWVSVASLGAAVLLGVVLMGAYAALFFGLDRYDKRREEET